MKEDIAKRKQAEELTLQREIKFSHIARMSYIRELTQMLAHEISQPLMIISAYIGGCTRRLEENIYDKQQIIDAMKIINQQVECVSGLIDHMKNYVHKTELYYEKINIHHVIKNTVALIAYEFPDFFVDIQYKFSENISLIEIDEAQIKLVILYLLRNGIEEMVEAKTKQPKFIIETSKINALTMSVCIKDNGRGISSEIQNRLFNSWFTTKSENIGMSLVTCRTILKAHSGNITAQSLLGGGASFKFILPITQEH